MIAAIVQCRMGSSRLPGKALKEIEGKPLLWHFVDRIRKSKHINKIIIATTTNKEDDAIIKFARKEGLGYYRGSEEDVLDRFYQASKKFRIDIIVRVTPDNPMTDPQITDFVIQKHLENNGVDYTSNVHPTLTFPDGLDTEVIPFETLERVWKEAKDKSHREHVTLYIRENPLLFKTYSVKNRRNLSSLKLSVDNKDDLKFAREIFKGLYKDKKLFLLKDILSLLEKKPDLLKINQDSLINEGLIKSLQKEGGDIESVKNLVDKRLVMPNENKIKKLPMVEAPKSRGLYKKAKEIIPGGVQLLSKRPELHLPENWPAYFSKAKGVEIWDLDGNKYIDMCFMGIGAAILGYSDDDVNNAVKWAIDRGTMTTLNSPEEVKLAETLLRLHPWAGGVRFGRTGGEAMAMAVRIARAYSGKDKVAFCGYHGWHDWYISSNLSNKKNLDGHLLPGLDPAGVPRSLRGTSLPFEYNNINALKKIIKNNKVGIIVIEPLRHTKPKDNFLHEVRKIADKIKAVLIFDEITIGWRMNLGGTHLIYKVEPDIAVFGKAIANGYPMTAIIGKKEVMGAAQNTFISSAFWTERVGPVAALATIEKLRITNAQKHIEKIGKVILEGWEKLAKKHNLKIKTLGPPCLATFTFDYENVQEIRTLFTQEMLKRGFLASSSIYISYAHKEEHVKRYLNAVNEVFELISYGIKKNEIKNLLEGPIAQSGFKRLT